MKNPRENIDYIKFARHFAGKQVEELVASFNREVGNNGWVGIRGFYDVALIDEFIRRGIDVSAVSDGRSISFARHVMYDKAANKLIAVPDGKRTCGPKAVFVE